MLVSSSLAGGPAFCNDKICAGQCLRPGQALTTCNGLSSIVNINGKFIWTRETTNGGRSYLTFNGTNPAVSDPPTPSFCNDTSLCMELSGQLVLTSCGTPTNLLAWSVARPEQCVQIFDGGDIWTSIKGVRQNFFFRMLETFE